MKVYLVVDQFRCVRQVFASWYAATLWPNFRRGDDRIEVWDVEE